MAVNTDTAVVCVSCHRPVAEIVTQEQRIHAIFEWLLQLALDDPDTADAIRRYFERKKPH